MCPAHWVTLSYYRLLQGPAAPHRIMYSLGSCGSLFMHECQRERESTYCVMISIHTVHIQIHVHQASYHCAPSASSIPES